MVTTPNIYSLPFILELLVIREKQVFTLLFCNKNKINMALLVFTRQMIKFGQRLHQVKMEHSEALRNNYLTGANHGFHLVSQS